MTDIAALVERLRDAFHAWNNPPSEALPRGAGVVLEAADALKALQAENERLRLENKGLRMMNEKAEAALANYEAQQKLWWEEQAHTEEENGAKWHALVSRAEKAEAEIERLRKL